VVLTVLGGVLTAIGATLSNVTPVSMRQALCPPRLQARMNASVRFMVWGTQPLGAVTGGLLVGVLGFRPTLWVGAVGAAFSVWWIVFSPVFAMTTMPEQVAD